MALNVSLTSFIESVIKVPVISCSIAWVSAKLCRSPPLSEDGLHDRILQNKMRILGLITGVKLEINWQKKRLNHMVQPFLICCQLLFLNGVFNLFSGLDNLFDQRRVNCSSG